jgi:hypothetical protein
VKKVVLLFSKEKGATGIFDGISAGSERVTWVEMKRRKKKWFRTTDNYLLGENNNEKIILQHLLFSRKVYHVRKRDWQPLKAFICCCALLVECCLAAK